MSRQQLWALFLALIGWVAVLASTTPLICRLDQPDQLRPCVQNVLDQYRPQLAARFDPLRLPSHSGSSGGHRYWLSNIGVEGASSIQIREVKVNPQGPTEIFILLTVNWPHLRAGLDARAKLCKRILWSNFCITVRARPQISLTDATASLSTRWSSVVEGEKLTIIPSDTKLSIRLGDIHVNPRFRGLLGFIYKLFGSIARRFVNNLVRKQWERLRPQVEGQMAKHIEQVINRHVGPALSHMLKGRLPF